MATQTTHYSLVKPAYEDQADVGVLNGDLDQIDELIYTANQDMTALGRSSDAGLTWLSAADTYVEASPRTCQFYRRGKLCFVNTNIRLKAGAFTSSVTLGTIPTGYRPLFISRGIWLISPVASGDVAVNSRVQFAFEPGGDFTMMHAEGTAGFVRGILVYIIE